MHAGCLVARQSISNLSETERIRGSYFSPSMT
jgi:hypothetical protein